LQEIIARKFRETRYQTVKDWWAFSKCPLSEAMCTQVIYKHREPSLPTAITMLYCLEVPAEEIAEICRKHGDTVFHRLMTPVSLTDEESQVLGHFRALQGDKRRLAMELLQQMGGVIGNER